MLQKQDINNKWGEKNIILCHSAKNFFLLWQVTWTYSHMIIAINSLSSLKPKLCLQWFKVSQQYLARKFPSRLACKVRDTTDWLPSVLRFYLALFDRYSNVYGLHDRRWVGYLKSLWSYLFALSDSKRCSTSNSVTASIYFMAMYSKHRTGKFVNHTRTETQ